MTYAEKLKSPKWQKKRLEVLQHHNFTCRKCGSNTDALHVHHMWYLRGRDPWDYDLPSYTVLCEKCHSAVTLIYDEIHYTILRFLKAMRCPELFLEWVNMLERLLTQTEGLDDEQ